MLGDGKATLAIYSGSARYNQILGFLLSSFNGDLGVMNQPLSTMQTAVPSVGVPAPKPGTQQLESVVAAIAGSPFPIRVIVLSQPTATKLKALLAAAHLQATVVLAPR